jgi:hypothetical protein
MVLVFATESASQDLNLPEESIYKDTFEPSPNVSVQPEIRKELRVFPASSRLEAWKEWIS